MSITDRKSSLRDLLVNKYNIMCCMVSVIVIVFCTVCCVAYPEECVIVEQTEISERFVELPDGIRNISFDISTEQLDRFVLRLSAEEKKHNDDISITFTTEHVSIGSHHMEDRIAYGNVYENSTARVRIKVDNMAVRIGHHNNFSFLTFDLHDHRDPRYLWLDELAETIEVKNCFLGFIESDTYMTAESGDSISNSNGSHSNSDSNSNSHSHSGSVETASDVGEASSNCSCANISCTCPSGKYNCVLTICNCTSNTGESVTVYNCNCSSDECTFVGGGHNGYEYNDNIEDSYNEQDQFVDDYETMTTDESRDDWNGDVDQTTTMTTGKLGGNDSMYDGDQNGRRTGYHQESEHSEMYYNGTGNDGAEKGGTGNDGTENGVTGNVNAGDGGMGNDGADDYYETGNGNNGDTMNDNMGQPTTVYSRNNDYSHTAEQTLTETIEASTRQLSPMMILVITLTAATVLTFVLGCICAIAGLLKPNNKIEQIPTPPLKT